MRRSLLVLSFGLLLVWVGSLPLAAAEGSNTPHPAAEQEFFSRINDERTSRGLAALRWHTQGASVARAHSEDMADDGRIYHNDALGSQMSGWSSLGENVGVGPSVAAIHGAFMGSSAHRSNILGSFTHVGVGVVERDGSLYVTQVFVTPSGSSGSGSGSGSGGSGGSGSGSGGSGGSGSGGSGSGGSSDGGSRTGGSSPKPRPAATQQTEPVSKAASRDGIGSRVRVATAAPIRPLDAAVSDGVAEGTLAALERLTDQDVMPALPAPCLPRRAGC